MGSKVEKHLSRLAMPKTWKIKRKGIKYVTRPLPGAHSFKQGLPLSVLLRDVLKLARTTKEAKNILHNQEVLIDGTRVKENKHIVGFMDIITVPKIKKSFRIIFSKKGKLVALEIKPDEAKFKPCKLVGKKIVRKGKMQLNLYDGKNILADKKEAKVGDTIVLEIPSKKVKDVLKLEKGSTVYLTGGKHIGEIGIVDNIKEDVLIYKRDKDTYETSKRYAFVIGKDKPIIKIE